MGSPHRLQFQAHLPARGSHQTFGPRVKLISILLDLYEDKWISLNRGNFKAKHWSELAQDIQNRCGVLFTYTQWETMKKMYMKEKQKESSSGAEPSRWDFYSRMEDLLGGTPKVSGLNDGFRGEEFVIPEVVSLAEDEDMVASVADEEGGLPYGEEDEASILGGVPINDSAPSNVPTATFNEDGV
ncbi:hypothetical protein L7F22_037836 [Adiantum nelumboides]|nr:hypothetical protein [Adiantum nelumboides]